MQVSSAILGNVDVNAPRQYTQQDDQQFAQAGKALRDNRMDLFTAEGAKRNLDGIDEFFQRNRHLPVTVQNVFRAVEERKSEFIWLTPAQHDWYKAAEQNLDIANQVANYLASTSGRPGALVKDGDPLFTNLLHLFTELQSRRESVSAQTIANAENRIANRPGPKLHYVPQPRRTEPISRAAKEDDGSPFLGTDMVKTPDGGWRNKNAAEQAADRRAAEQAANPRADERLSVEDREFREMANELLCYGTHGQQAAIKQEFDKAVASGASWRRVHEACLRVVNMYKRSAQISGWAGR